MAQINATPLEHHSGAHAEVLSCLSRKHGRGFVSDYTVSTDVGRKGYWYYGFIPVVVITVVTATVILKF